MRTLLLAALVASAIPAQAASPDLGEFVGQYDLADGRVLVVSTSGKRLFAQLDERRIEMVSAGDASFVARQGYLRLDFVQHANGNVSAVRLRAAPSAR